MMNPSHKSKKSTDLKHALAKLATKVELKREFAKLATKAELKREVAKLATKAELKQEASNLEAKLWRVYLELKSDIAKCVTQDEFSEFRSQTFIRFDKLFDLMRTFKQEHLFLHRTVLQIEEKLKAS